MNEVDNTIDSQDNTLPVFLHGETGFQCKFNVKVCPI